MEIDKFRKEESGEIVKTYYEYGILYKSWFHYYNF